MEEGFFQAGPLDGEIGDFYRLGKQGAQDDLQLWREQGDMLFSQLQLLDGELREKFRGKRCVAIEADTAVADLGFEDRR